MGMVVSNAQAHAFQTRYDWVVIEDIAKFLLQHCDAMSVTPANAPDIAAHAYQRGKQLGLRKTHGLKLFAYLVAETGGDALVCREIEAALTQDGVNPDAAMDEIMNVAALSAAQAG